MLVVRPPTTDLFAGIGDLINALLGVPDYRTKTAALTLVAQASGTVDGEDFVQSLFGLLRENWLRALTAAKASRQNFRWHAPQLTIADRNTSPEVTLERALIRASVDSGRTDWSNQVPVVSGIAGARAYKRQAIDLVHGLPDGGFEFVELKITSDTPLYATIEVLLYGLFWLLSRQSEVLLGYPANPILDTPALQLSTLAPATFYVGLTPSGFAGAIDRGVCALGLRHGVSMGFRQTAFPEGFRWPASINDAELLHWLGVALSHTHGDHNGLTGFVHSSIPVFTGARAQTLVMASRPFVRPSAPPGGSTTKNGSCNDQRGPAIEAPSIVPYRCVNDVSGLSFDTDHRPQPRDAVRQTSLFGGSHHGPNVLVGAGCFFGDAPCRRTPDQNPFSRQIIDNPAPAPLLECRMP